MTDSINRARKIKVILFDVDGVLTDGSIWLFPAAASARSTDTHAQKHADAPGFGIISQNLVEAKGFNAHDGTAISLARLGGLKTGMVTKRISETVALRARDLKIDFLFQGAENKSAVLDKILAESGLREEQIRAARAGRSYNEPSFVAGEWRVFDDAEAKRFSEEGQGFVIIANEEGDVSKRLRHERLSH